MIFGTTKLNYNTESIDWIYQSLNLEAPSNSLEQVLPNQFDHYIKLFLPIAIKEESGDIIKFSPEALANRAKVPYSKTFSITDIISELNGIPENLLGQIHDKPFVQELIDILGPKTTCVFHGSGDDLLPEKFETPWLYEGRVKDLKTILKQLNSKNDFSFFKFFPNYIYSDALNWCMGWDVMVNEVGVLLLGCDNAVYDKIKSSNVLHFEELQYNDIYIEFIKH